MAPVIFTLGPQDICSHFCDQFDKANTTSMSELPNIEQPNSLKPLTLKMVFNFIMNAPEVRAVALVICKTVCSVSAHAVNSFSFLGSNTVKHIWVGSHVFCITGYVLYLCLQGPLYYRLSVCGALLTYSLSVIKDFQMLSLSPYQNGRSPPLILLLNSESALLVCSTTIHAVTPPNLLKLMSFAVFSWLNLAWFMVNEIIPNNSFTDSLLPLIKYVDPLLMNLASYADHSVVLVYFYQFVTGQTLLVYLAIFTYLSLRRIEHSNFSRKTLFNLVCILDSFSQTSYVPRQVAALAASMKAHVSNLVMIEPAPNHSEDEIHKGYTSMYTRNSTMAYDGFSVIDDIEL